MRPGMRAEIWRIVLVGAVFTLAGWSVGFFMEFILIGAIGYLMWMFTVADRVFQWIDRGMRGIPPDIDGVWGEITDTLNRQRRRHRRAQEKMRGTIKRVTRVTEVLDEGLVILTNDRNLDWWNSSAKRLLSLRTSDRGTSVLNLIRDPNFVDYINSEDFSGSVKLRPTNHDDILLEFSASYFGAKREVVLLIEDVSEVNHLQRLRTEFVGNVSHELRTPLTVMRGYIETLQDIPGGSELQQKAFGQMSDQVVRMQSLADDLILLSRLEESDQSPEQEKFNLAELLSSLVSEAQSLSNGLHIFHLECGVEEIVGNEKDIHGALSNILFNAVKHNPQGAEINLSVTRRYQGVMISIKDDGVGIDSFEIPRLTERFYRGDNSRNSQTGGSGLGLAIAKHGLNKAGGTLTIRSRLGQGATFDCWLPQAEE